MLCRYAGLARRRAGCNRWAMTSPIRRYAPEAFPILGFLTALVSFAIPLNPFLVGLILAGAVVAAVHHAEVIAHRVGDTFGPLILALAVTVIEVGLILTLMQAERSEGRGVGTEWVRTGRYSWS